MAWSSFAGLFTRVLFGQIFVRSDGNAPTDHSRRSSAIPFWRKPSEIPFVEQECD